MCRKKERSRNYLFILSIVWRYIQKNKRIFNEMELFYARLDTHIENLNKKFRSKYVIKKTVYDNILSVLKGTSGDAQFRFWVNKNFMLVTIGGLQVVYEKKSNKPVIIYEQIYKTIKECHERVGHHGHGKTWKEVIFYTYKYKNNRNISEN